MSDEVQEQPDKGRVSLHPLTFEEALAGLLAVEPDDEEGDDHGDEG